MRKKTSSWFEIDVSYQKLTEEGLEKQVRERYVVEACSFIEAENAIVAEISPMVVIGYMLDVQKIAWASYKDVIFDDEKHCGVYYKVKLSSCYVTDKGNEKNEIVYLLVEASSIECARKKVAEALSLHDGCGIEIVGVAKVRLLDVLENG